MYLGIDRFYMEQAARRGWAFDVMSKEAGVVLVAVLTGVAYTCTYNCNIHSL